MTGTTDRSHEQATAVAVLAGISLSHLLNDTIQAVLPAIYPMLKSAFALTFAQVGLMTLTLQVTSSLLQPAIGFLTDRRPTPFARLSSGTKSRLTPLPPTQSGASGPV